MKKTKDSIIILLLLCILTLLFKYSTLVKASVLASINLWITSLIPSMLPLYIMIDLLINYGILERLYKIFKTNKIAIVIISLLTGTPSNAKYISEFYKNGYIDEKAGNLLLSCSYSPNPLFVLAFAPSLRDALIILSYIYITNIIIYLIFRKKLKSSNTKEVVSQKLSFIDCLTESIYKSFKVLVLILGIVVVYGVINTLISKLGINNSIILSILELTNALAHITENHLGICYMIFACTFAGLSIHTQIKSILEDTNLSYKYFLIGRLLALIPILIIIMLN